jgi:hypothetical protein
MKKILYSLATVFTFTCCGSDKIIDITPIINIKSGLVVNIPFDSSLVESILGTFGINNGAEFCANRKGSANTAIHFNRIDANQITFGDLENASFTSGTFTASCWILLEDSIKPCAVFSKRNAFGGFEYSLDNHFRNKEYFNFDNWIENGTNSVYGIDPLNALASINLGNWQHLVYVADGTILKVYVNGILQLGTDLKVGGTVFSNTDKPLVIGNGGGYGENYYFQGAIDDLKMYNRALSSSEVKALFDE